MSNRDPSLRRNAPRLELHMPEPIIDRPDGTNPEHEALLADSGAWRC